MEVRKRIRIRNESLKGAEVKKNINFLDKPMWLPHKSNINDKYIVETRTNEFKVRYENGSGYSITSGGLGLPNHEDIKWLNFMLFKLQTQSEKGGDKYTITSYSPYKVLKEMGISVDTPHYFNSFLESLERWKQVRLKFKQGSYYIKKKDGKKVHTTKVLDFNILGTVVMEYVNPNNKQNNRIKFCKIHFDREWVDAHQEDFHRKDAILPSLSMSPIAYRLYEILSKSFWNEEVNIMRFSGKLLDKKLPKDFQRNAHRRRVIEKAVNNINDTSKMKYELGIKERKEDGDIFEFTKL